MGKAEHCVGFAVLFPESTCVSPVFVKSKHVQHPGTAPSFPSGPVTTPKRDRGLGGEAGEGLG